MPDFIGPLTDMQDDRAARTIIIEWYGLMIVDPEPGITAKKPATNSALVFVENEILAISAAGKLGPGNFDRCSFVSRDPSVRDGNSPKLN